jgi:hypothetical protein
MELVGRIPITNRQPNKLQWDSSDGHYNDVIILKTQERAASVRPYLRICFFLGLPILMVHVQQILPQRVNQPNLLSPYLLWKVGFLSFFLLPYGQNSCDLLNVPYIFEHVFFTSSMITWEKFLVGFLQPADLFFFFVLC